MKRPLNRAACLAAAVLIVSHAAPVLAQDLNEWVLKGFDALNEGRNERALECFLKAHEENPYAPDPAVECYVGLGCFKTGQYREALEYYERAALHDPAVADSAFLFYRASCLRALGLVQLERDAWREVIAWDPESRFAQTAREALAGDADRQPAAPRDLIDTGRIHWDTLPHAAIAYFREAYDRPVGSHTPLAGICLAYSLNRTGQYEALIALPDKVRDSHELADGWHLQRALARFGLEQWESTLEELAAVGADPALAAQADYVRTLCRIHLGDRREADASLPRLAQAFDAEAMDLLSRLAQLAYSGIAE